MPLFRKNKDKGVVVAMSSSSASANGGTSTSTSPRKRLPVPQPDKNASSLWSFLKHCVGRELSKITMPVQWNEPISLLQRLSEYMNYSHLLKIASEQRKDEDTRMLFVATFAVSALASNFERMGKPFNPLLGETFELRRDGFRIVCEQVGHHPPVSAFHAEDDSDSADSGGFVFRGTMYPKVKFWGKSIEFQPKGVCAVEFPGLGEVYTWSNVNCVVHNVIVGSLWMEHVGVMEIVNRTTGHRCVLSFKQGGWFSGQNDLHVVEGFLVDADKKKKRFVYGRWTEFICAVPISAFEEHFNVNADKMNENASNLPKHEPLEMGAIPASTVLWRVEPRPEDCDKYYNFSTFAMGLNALDEGLELPGTDSRQRPDIRSLENGDLERAAAEKERLEQKQREYRKPYKSCKKESDWWTPRWFRPVVSEHTGEPDWRFVGGYWGVDHEEKKKGVPDIF